MDRSERLTPASCRPSFSSDGTIQFVLAATIDPDVLALRAGAVGGNTAAKPPLLVRRNELEATLMILLRAAQLEAV